MRSTPAGRLSAHLATSPWGSHAGTIIGYDTTDGKRIMIVRPNLAGKLDVELEWNRGYGSFGIVTIEPTAAASAQGIAAKRSIEVVVDDFDTGFVMRGDWATQAGAGVGGSARVITSTDPSNLGPAEDTAIATWTAQMPLDGLYDIKVFWPYQDSAETLTNMATYHVSHAEGTTLVRRSQHAGPAGWISLGAFPLARGANATVKLGNLTGDSPPRKVWADAVQFIWRAPILIQRDTGGPMALIIDGKLREFRDVESLGVLRMKAGPGAAG